MLTVAALLLVWLVVLTTGISLGLWALTRHNRVSAEHPSAAPLSWVFSPRRVARLHRRLRGTVAWVQGDIAPNEFDHLRRQLVEQAVRLDLELTRAASAPKRKRRQEVRRLTGGVTELERLAVRVHAMTRPAGTPLSGMLPVDPTVEEHLQDLRTHLDLLDAARAELADIERQVGLGGLPAIEPGAGEPARGAQTSDPLT